MHLLYLTFGKKFSVHLQAAFSMYSFLAYPDVVQSVTVITDAPEFYTHLQQRIHIQTIDKATLEEWEGPHRFFWRIKIRAIQDSCARHPGEPVLYLDGDTFCFTDAGTVAAQLRKGAALMHENEGPLAEATTKTERRMWQQVGGKTYFGYPLPVASCMWNAGVVGIPNTTGAAECSFALALCDSMCADGVTRRLVEQFALSVALERYYGLQPAASHIAHYWSNKEEWDVYISRFFSEAYFGKLSTDQCIARMHQAGFADLPVKRIRKNTAARLHRLVDDLFPDKRVDYLQAPPRHHPPRPATKADALK